MIVKPDPESLSARPAEDDYPTLKFSTEGSEALDELDRLRLLADPTLSFKDMEMHIRDGRITFNGVFDQDGGAPAIRLFAALMFHMVLGEENELPPNYREYKFELDITPGGEFETLCLAVEVIRPGGETSHQIRQRLESRIAELEAKPPKRAKS